ncbi:AAA family ATPase [Streptomyces sp. NPDC047829]|uniref:helix-turn-helix transcriptional regulator n=1 Tax=Streptomyces sp. NPDC047829 TaxID=3154609 RepID=UPI0033C1EDFA
MTGPLSERDDALALLAAETERARAGTGALVLLRGATGTGRTAVLEAAARHAADRGLRVLRARCSPEDTGVPLATVLHLLGPVAEFTDLAPGGDDRGSAARLWRLLRSYADEGPLMLAVDDVHLADDSSRRWLVEAARRVDRLPVLVVVTERSQYDIDPRPAGLTQALSPSLVRTHTLAPLSDAAAAALVRAAFPAAGARWTAECVRAGAGSPLLLHALLDDLRGIPPTEGDSHGGGDPWVGGEVPAGGGPYAGGDMRAAGDAYAGGDMRAAGDAYAGGVPYAEGDVHATGGDSPAGDDSRAAGGDTPAGGGPYAGGDVPAGGVTPAGGEVPARGGPHAGGDTPAGGGPYAGGDVPAGGDTPAGGEVPAGGGPHAGRVPPARGVPSLPDSSAALYPGAYPAAVSWWLNSAGDATADVARCLATLEQAWPPGRRDAPPAPPAARGAARPAPPPPGGGSVPAGEHPPPYPHRTDRERDAGGAGGEPHARHHLLAEAAGADPARVAGWLAAMTRLGLLRPDAAGQPRYAHPLLRDAVLTGWPRSRREAAHRVAAEAMLRRGDRVEAVARHLLRTPAVGLPWALRVLRDAVTVAVHDARPDDAVGYLRRVLDEPLPDDLRQRLLTELGSLEYASADTPAAIARLAEAQHLPADPRNRVRTAVALGTALAGRGEIRTAMEVLRRTEGRLSGHPGLTRTVQTAVALLSDQDLATRQEVYRSLCEAGARSPEMLGTAGQALLVRYAATAALISAEEAMSRLRALLAQPTDPLAEPFLLGTAAAVAQWADELDEADRLVERGLAGQHPALLHPMQHALLNTRADIAGARGDHARLLAADGEPGGPTPFRTGPSNRDAHVLMALVHTGRADEARRFADRFDLRAVPENWELNRFLYARGVLRAAIGDPAGALHDFLECGRRQTAREVVSPVVTPWRTAVAECRLALGGGQEALALATEELRLARVWDTPRTVGRALRVLGTATGGRRGLELAEEAVRTLRKAPADADMELIPALLAQGRQLTAAGERGRARDCLREAAELAERKGAQRLLTLVGQALRAGGARGPATARTGSGALTGSERRIAELAADGRTNTEIADLLHLARRTVETHLTSTYRKLRIRRRTELPDALVQGRSRAAPPAPPDDAGTVDRAQD